MAAILHPVQCAIGPNDEAKRIVESRMAGEVAVGCQSLNTCSGQRGDSAWRCLWLKKRRSYRRRCKLYKLSASLLGFHSGIFYTLQRSTKNTKEILNGMAMRRDIANELLNSPLHPCRLHEIRIEIGG